MSWYTDVSTWTKKPPAIQVYNDQGESFDYLPERTCHLVGEDWGYTIAPTCGACGHKWVAFKYCPNCGAKVVES